MHLHAPTSNAHFEGDESSDTDWEEAGRPQPDHQDLLIPGRNGSRSSASSPSRSRGGSPHGARVLYASDTEDEVSSPLLSWRGYRRSWWGEQRSGGQWLNEQRGEWLSGTRGRRRGRSWRMNRASKRWLRSVVHHPLFPSQPITIVLTLTLLSIFAILVTLLLIYILNPDKEPLPWRAYCTYPEIYNTHYPPSTSPPYPSLNNPPPASVSLPPPPLDDLPPAGIFLGIFSIDSASDRRQFVRSTWANHPRSRNGANPGDDGDGTSRTIVRFIVGQPRKDWERRIKLEMELYNDIIILPMQENMNGGKTHTFFSWASINAWVPPIYFNSTTPPPNFTYSNYTSSPPPLAPHDPYLARRDLVSPAPKNWVRPDYVVKVDDDSFIMLAELEARLRMELHTIYQDRSNKLASPRAPSPAAVKSTSLVTGGGTTMIDTNNSVLGGSRTPTQLTDNDPLIYWGYLVTNKYHQFMAGELYALSWTLVDWVAKDPTVKTMTKGAEDKQTAKWMRIHPRRDEIRWTSERCWIYDHPRSGTVYSHGFLFPSEVTRVKRHIQDSYGGNAQKVLRDFNQTFSNGNTPTPTDWAHSSVSTFGVRYPPPLPDLSTSHSVEALVEGSEMSLLREGSPMSPKYAWAHREGRRKRYKGQRVGGTIAVHFIKKHMWFLETALALLEGDERSEDEIFQGREESDMIRTSAVETTEEGDPFADLSATPDMGVVQQRPSDSSAQ